MLITPRVSEKSYKLAAENIYVFDVPLNANKAQVQVAVEAEFKDAKVKDVRLMIAKGKVKAVNKGKRARPGRAARKDVKKAYVTLAEGKIEIPAFTEINNEIAAQEAAKEQVVEEKKAETKTTSKRRSGKEAK